MNQKPTRKKRAVSRAVFYVGLIVWPFMASAQHGVVQGMPLRNQNPFMQIFGLPPFQSATLVPAGSLEYAVSLDIVSHAESGANPLEDISIDGESYFLAVSFRRGLTERLEIGIDVPLVAHAGGFLDSAIENWHDLLGLSNSKRQGPDSQLGFRYSNAGVTLYELNSTSIGIGDIQLTAAMPLRKASETNPLSVSIRSSVKLATGASSELRGSGATDFSLGLYASDRYTLWRRNLDISGFAGVLLLGDGEVLPDLQRSALTYGGAAAAWWISDRFGVSAQLQAEGPYYDSEVDELGGASAQLAVGFEYRVPQQGTSLHFSITEDIVAGTTTTPDFGVHFSVRRTGRKL